MAKQKFMVMDVSETLTSASKNEYKLMTLAPVIWDEESKQHIPTGGRSRIKPRNVNDALPVGTIMPGQVFEFKTTEYEINGRKVTKASVLAFADENAEELVQRMLDRHNATFIKSDGTLNKVFAPTP